MAIMTLKFKGWRIELDTAQVFPNDPGNGTPAMVYSPKGESATFNRAIDAGTVGDYDTPIPDNVWNWIDESTDEINAFLWPDD